MDYEFFKVVAAVAGALGFNEMRIRWLKKDVDHAHDSISEAQRDIDKHYMTKTETLDMYSIMNKANEAKIANIEHKLDVVDKKLDQILMIERGK